MKHGGEQLVRLAVRCSRGSSRTYTTSLRRQERQLKNAEEIKDFLSKPTWSVASLLPGKDAPSISDEVSSKQLRHLLRLSALPPPKDDAEEQQMLKTLTSQLHFVRKIQSVDTTGVEPLHSVRDETAEGRKAGTLGLEQLRDALAKEEVVGKYHKRLRRKSDPERDSKKADWDVLGAASTKVGRFFVVEGGKD